MIDIPPEQPLAALVARDDVEQHLPMEEREDGSLVIDLMPLNEQCQDTQPDPINPTIVVCRTRNTDQRVDNQPPVDAFGNAIPRARLKLSENSALSLDAKEKAVGGHTANAALVTVTVDF